MTRVMFIYYGDSPFVCPPQVLLLFLLRRGVVGRLYGFPSYIIQKTKERQRKRDAGPRLLASTCLLRLLRLNDTENDAGALYTRSGTTNAHSTDA